MNESEWWKRFSRPKAGESGFDASWAQVGLALLALGDGRRVLAASRSGILRGELADFCRKLGELGAQSLWREGDARINSAYDEHFVWPKALVNVSGHSEDGGLSIHIYSADERLFDSLVELANGSVIPNSTSGRAYVLATGRHGAMKLQSVGFAGIPLERDNYEEQTAKEMEHVLSDLRKDDPCGRLVVLEGEPGTGKTFFLRGILSECPTAMFVVISPHIVERLTDPDFVSLLLSEREEETESGPIILVVEDADSCLVPRQADNMASIGTLLNLCDGILGRLTNVRILASTNARRVDMDQALLRPGRLCRRLEFKKLRKEHAARVLVRLGRTDHALEERTYSLAELYAMMREPGASQS